MMTTSGSADYKVDGQRWSNLKVNPPPPRVSCRAQDLVGDPAQQGMEGRPGPAPVQHLLRRNATDQT